MKGLKRVAVLFSFLAMLLVLNCLDAETVWAESNFWYQELDDGTLEIGGFSGEASGNLLIPSEINGKKVTSIGRHAFSGCSGFTGSLVIPESVTSIGSYAFYECSGFTGSLVIPESVTSIGSWAFFGCSGLTGNLVIPKSVTSIGIYAFSRSGLSDIYVESKDVVLEGSALYISSYSGIFGYKGSTAETYARDGGYTFIYLDQDIAIEEYRVSTIDELKGALGSYRRIILADGIYVWDDKYISLDALTNLTIEAENPGQVELLYQNCYEPVIRIDQCRNINIIGCILGHKSASIGGCASDGDVIRLAYSSDVKIQQCDLYGCGVTALEGWCRNMLVEDCVIRDCMTDIAELTGENLMFKNCIFSGNAYYEVKGTWADWAEKTYAFSGKGNIAIENCTFLNNYNEKFCEFETKAGSSAAVTGCKFYNNTWQNQTPKAYGICLNGITWQVDGETLKIGYPLALDAATTIESKKGEVLSYSKYSVPWADYQNLKIKVADGITGMEGFAEEYKITYQLNGGENASSNPAVYTEGKETSLENPTQIGYTFEGWYTDSEYKNKITKIESSTTGDLNLYAKWKKNANDLADAKVTLSSTSYSYDGKSKKPSVKVTLDGKTLKEKEDYTVSYKNNKNIGKASVTVSGKNKYTGKITKKFTIKAKKGKTFTVEEYKYKITGDDAVSFAGVSNKKLKKITVPKTVKIGGKKFSVTAVADKALEKNTKVEKVTLGDNVKTIGKYAFSGCTKLSSVTVGTGLKTIKKSAFKNCKKLGTLQMKSTKVKTVEKDCLKDTKSKIKISVPKSKLASYKKTFKNAGMKKAQWKKL